MKHNRPVLHVLADASTARGPCLARRERQTPAIRLGLFLLLGLVAVSALLSHNPSPASAAQASAVAAGNFHTCALTAAGAVKCWGYNGSGQLGDGSTTTRLTPTDVSGLSSGVAAITASNHHTCALTTAGAVKCWGDNYSGQLGDGTTTDRYTPTDVSGLSSGVAAISAGGYHTCALTTAGAVKCWGANSDGQLGDGATTDQYTPTDVSGLGSGVTAIAAGYAHTCALTAADAVKCWGYNGSGRLGDGTTTNRNTPTDVSGLSSGVAAIAAGDEHTCALITTGAVKCWGYNWAGQIGDGSNTTRLTPTDVSGLSSGVAAIAAGGAHTCALTTAGAVKCWGYNWYGQLGDGTNTTRLTPTNVSGLTSGVAAIAAGWGHTCALTAAGAVKCWGRNVAGQLGDGATINRYTPIGVFGLSSGVAAIAAGNFHTCALTAAGAVKCWGDNFNGQLGDGTTTDRYTPTDVSGLSSGVAAIAAGGSHTCALTAAGAVKCWGANFYGQLGDGATTNRNTPTDVSGLSSGVAAIAAGGYHTCALTTAGAVKCWGQNGGALGDGTTTNRTTPVDVAGLSSGVAAISAGGNHTCALTAADAVKCWGYNGSGQLGDGSTTTRLTPTDVSGLSSGVAAIAVGVSHTCALTTAGAVKCWGYNAYGQLGDTTTTGKLTPTSVSGLSSGVTAIAAGDAHTCALTAAGGVKCWGGNGAGQLGDGTTTNRLTPTNVSGLTSGVAAIAAGYAHTCALITTGAVKCWGRNDGGQLGDGTTINRYTPIGVFGLSSGVAAIAAGNFHTCALTAASAVKCWGYNYSGQLGDGTTTDRYTPTDVSGLSSGVAAIAAGGSHTCALTAAGAVKCWGENGAGQLGDGTTTDRYTPTDVSGLSSGVAAISAGGYHTCALTTAGAVKCWGGNGDGQLGDGTNTNRNTPTDVSGLGSGVTAIAAGDSHTCALTTAGAVKCWGANWAGQLGDNTNTNRNTPTDVSGLSSGVAAIAAGDYHTCALTAGGGVKCWGANYDGELGDGTNTTRLTPVDVVGLSSAVAAAVGGFAHTCALTAAGAVKCWGWNGWGQLGDSTTIGRLTPTNVSGLTSGVAAIAAGYAHTCALITTGAVKCWGWNVTGQLGDGTTIGRLTATDVSGFEDTDNDGMLDFGDNCPTTPNPGQENLDGDAMGDACDPDDDNDLVNDTDETPCGSDPMDITPPLSRPERIDGAFAGVDDDGDTAIDEALPAGAANFDCDGDGYTGAAESGTPLCGNAKNDDDKVGIALAADDAVIDDGCPGGPAQVGAFSEAQFNIGGNDQDPCGLTSWPSDLVTGGVPLSTNKINVLDLTSFLAPVAVRRLNTAPGQPAFDKRWDLSPGRGVFATMINVQDLTSLIAGSGGYPPMLGGVRAFNGPACPWPP